MHSLCTRTYWKCVLWEFSADMSSARYRYILYIFLLYLFDLLIVFLFYAFRTIRPIYSKPLSDNFYSSTTFSPSKHPMLYLSLLLLPNTIKCHSIKSLNRYINPVWLDNLPKTLEFMLAIDQSNHPKGRYDF